MIVRQPLTFISRKTEIVASPLFYRTTVKDVSSKLGLYHSSCSSGGEEILPPFEWYEKTFPKLRKLTQQLRNVDFVDGTAVCINDDVSLPLMMNARVVQKITTLKSLVRVFIGSPLVQQKIKENMAALGGGEGGKPIGCFRKSYEREAMIVDSLTKVGNFLKVSAQQRKVVRLTICPQVTHHRIWTGSLKEVLNELKLEMDHGIGTSMAPQIVTSCLNFLVDSDTRFEEDGDSSCSSWMRLSSAPKKKQATDSSMNRTWEDILEMFDDLIKCLRYEKEEPLLRVSKKLEVMKEGLAQIKDVVMDRGIGYREAKHQESLVQKKLSSTLGHSSPCLFTLLLYYLYGQVRDIEVDLSGGLYQSDDGDKKSYCLRMGRILSSDEERMVMRGVKHLNRVLGLFKFVWETAEMDGVLELQGHLFCVDAEDRTITYRGNSFLLHGISF